MLLQRCLEPTMYYVHFFIACLIAWFATQLSTKSADEFIYGKRDADGGSDANGMGDTDGVRPGSGKFFDTIASTYDVLNEVISLGYQQKWRRITVAKILPADAVLDVSTGTADLAIVIAANRTVNRVVALDPSVEMLKIARKKVSLVEKSVSPITLVEGSAEALPFDDASFEAVTVAFGVRNFEDREKGLSEIARVLTPGGKLAILELSVPANATPLVRISMFVVKYIMPYVAGLFSGRPEAYHYLSSSMDKFPCKDEFSRMLTDAGLVVDEYDRMPPFGLGPDLYIASKPESESQDET